MTWSPPTQHEVVKALVDLSRQLHDLTQEVAKLDEEAVNLKGAFEVSYARAFLTSEGAMDIRKQEAVLCTADEKLAFEIAEQKLRACKERLRTVRDQIEIARSLNSAVKAEWAAGAVGQT